MDVYQYNYYNLRFFFYFHFHQLVILLVLYENQLGLGKQLLLRSTIIFFWPWLFVVYIIINYCFIRSDKTIRVRMLCPCCTFCSKNFQSGRWLKIEKVGQWCVGSCGDIRFMDILAIGKLFITWYETLGCFHTKTPVDLCRPCQLSRALSARGEKEFFHWPIMGAAQTYAFCLVSSSFLPLKIAAWWHQFIKFVCSDSLLVFRQ